MIEKKKEVAKKKYKQGNRMRRRKIRKEKDIEEER
jgi:hypothetical protein